MRSRSRRGWVGVSGALALVAAMLAGGRTSHASGFLIYDLSGAAIGRASAVTAGVTEPAAVWFNPAALAYMGGVSASAGGVLVTARSRFSPSGGGADTDSDRGVFFLPTVFAHAAVSDRVALGMGVYTAFGIGIAWPNGWIGREAAISASLKTLAFNPTVAVKLHEQVSLAVGFDAIRGVVDFRNGLPSIIGGDVRLAGGAWGYGYNVGVLGRIVPERLHVAATFRSHVKLSFDGRADFTPGSADFVPLLPDEAGTAAITLPDIITVGVMGRPRSDLALSVDANLVLWHRYDRIDINFNTAPDRSIIPDGKDTVTLRAGADWTSPWSGLHLRGGLIYDRAAIPAQGLGPGLPDGSRVDGTLGAGWGTGPFWGDLGYMLVVFLPADARGGREGPEGTYHTLAHLIGLTLGASWR